jgi:hypothetical protein
MVPIACLKDPHLTDDVSMTSSPLSRSQVEAQSQAQSQSRNTKRRNGKAGNVSGKAKGPDGPAITPHYFRCSERVYAQSSDARSSHGMQGGFRFKKKFTPIIEVQTVHTLSLSL